MIFKHKKDFSLCDEIGECPYINIDIVVIDKASSSSTLSF